MTSAGNRILGAVLTVLLPSTAVAQDAPAPLPPPAEGDFAPFTPAPAEPPPAATPAPAPTPPPAQPPPPAATRPAPATATPGPAPKDCKEPRKGFFRGPIPNWAAGAVAGGAVGALAFSLVGLGAALVLNIAMVRGVLPAPSTQLPGVYALPLVALPVGAVLGAVIGGVVAPFVPAPMLGRPCTRGAGNDPTLRPTGTT